MVRAGALGVLIALASDDRVSWRAVELAGRGIAAYARSNRWVITTGKDSLSGLELAELLIAEEELIEQLMVELGSVEIDQMAREDVELRLETFVDGLEELYRDRW